MNNEGKATLRVVNYDEMMQLFEGLTERYQKQVAVSAMRMSAKIILTAAKQKFENVKKGKSKTNYKYIQFTTAAMRSRIGLKVGIKSYKAHWIEWGTNERFYYEKKTHKKKSIGAMKKTEFFYKTVDEKRDEAQKLVEDNLVKAMNNLVNRMNRKKV